MDTQRPTKEITTPIDGKKVILKEWVTGAEMRQIEAVYIEGANYDPNSTERPRMTAETYLRASNKTIEMVVISVDGITENIADLVIEMKKPDYDFVLAEIDAVTKGTAFKKKLS